jgi:outer membrane protein TolC
MKNTNDKLVRKTAFKIIPIFLFLNLAYALPPAGNYEALTIQSAVQEALQQNAALKNARTIVVQDQKTYGLAIAQVFPTIVGTGTAEYEKDQVNTGSATFGGNIYNNYNLTLSMNQPLWDGGAILAGVGFQKKQIQMDQYTIDSNSRDLALQVITDYYGILYNQRLLDTLHRTIAAIDESVRTTDRFYHNGRSQLTDLLQIKTTRALLVPQIKQAETAILTNASHLNYDLGSRNYRELQIVSDFAIPDPAEISKRIAHPNLRPEVERIHTQIDQFADTKTIQLAPNYPQVSAFGTIGQISTTKSNLLDASSTGWTLGLKLTVPLFSGLSSWRQREVLEAQDWELHYQADDLDNQETYNEVSAKMNFDAAVSVLKSDEEAFKLADATLKEAQRQYRLQTINMLTLVQDQQNYLQASSALDNAKYQYVTAAGALFVAKAIPMDQLIAMLH